MMDVMDADVGREPAQHGWQVVMRAASHSPVTNCGDAYPLPSGAGPAHCRTDSAVRHTDALVCEGVSQPGTCSRLIAGRH
jgi:hypothetical protein